MLRPARFAARAVAVIFLAVLFVLSGAPPAARADDAAGMQRDGTVIAQSHAYVSYRDLDVSSAAGAQILYSRIKRAARTLCDPEARRLRPPLSRAQRIVQCERVAVDAAVAGANLEGLTAVHRNGS